MICCEYFFLKTCCYVDNVKDICTLNQNYNNTDVLTKIITHRINVLWYSLNN